MPRKDVDDTSWAIWYCDNCHKEWKGSGYVTYDKGMPHHLSLCADCFQIYMEWKRIAAVNVEWIIEYENKK